MNIFCRGGYCLVFPISSILGSSPSVATLFSCLWLATFSEVGFFLPFLVVFLLLVTLVNLVDAREYLLVHYVGLGLLGILRVDGHLHGIFDI